VKKHKKILVLCPYPFDRAAGQRLKYEQYFSSWRKEGFSITISNFFDNGTWDVLYTKKGFIKRVLGSVFGYFRRLRDLSVASQYDVIYIFMWGTPIGLPLYEILLKKLNKRIIYDYDDSVFLKKKVSYSFRNLIKSPLKSRYLIKNAEAVILSSPSNLNYSINLNKHNNATYIPCSVNTDRFKNIDVFKDKKITIGWTGTFSSIKYLELLTPIFYELKKRLDFKLILITNFDYFLPDIDLEVISWSKEKEIEDLNRIQIGLYPLIEDEWALGKGGLKVIQYMAAEIPSVATNFGTAKDIIIDGHSGFLVSSNSDWVEKICELARNPLLRKEIGKNGRKIIENRFSLNANKKKYLDILNKLTIN
jgi:glycosyltransferase involved in cell wall biosynthesis